MRSALYVGSVRHRRYGAPQHEFTYPTYQVLLDLAELDALARTIPWFGYNGRGLTSFHDTDHLGSSANPVREKLQHWMEARGESLGENRVQLLTNLRVLGHVFNPVSYFFCMTGNGDLRHVVAEVNNTFGDSHCYLLSALDRKGDDAYAARCEKRLHVSPFIGMEDIGYQWLLTTPGPRLTVHIDEMRRGRKFFDATLQLERRPLTSRTLAATMLRYPLTPLHTVLRIHLQAFKLWRKGASFHRRPTPPPCEFQDA